MIGVDFQILYIAQQTLDELVSRLDGFKAMQRDCVLYSGTMCVEGDNVVNAHLNQLLQSKCAVK